MTPNIPDSPFSANSAGVHEHFMRECLVLARQASGQNESPVGSVLVHENRIIGRGIEGVKKHNDFTFHAEIECIREAAAALGSLHLEGCALYSTHEPCIMCSYVIRQSRIALVVIAVLSGEKGGLYSHFPVLTDNRIVSWGAPPMIITGVLEKECSGLK